MHHKLFILSTILIVFAIGTLSAQQSTLKGSSGGSSASAASNGSGDQKASTGATKGQAGAIELPQYFYKHFTGTISGTYHIVMNLTRMGGRVIGDYYYVDRGIPLFFGYDSTISDNGTIHLVETNVLEAPDSNDVTGVFDGHFVGQNEVRGTWRKSADSKPLPFAATSVENRSGAFDIQHETRSYFARSEGSAAMDVTYPVMRTDSAETDAALNSNVLTTILGMYESGLGSVPPTTVNQAMSDFIQTFTSQLDAMSAQRFSFPPWTYSINSNVLYNSDGILSLRYESFSYEGGAHPNTMDTYASYVRATGSEITLDDLLRPGYQKALNVIGLKEFKREHGIAPGKSLQDAGYLVSDKEFQLNSNFLITKAGLLFLFNQYEISPYYFGAQQVLITYRELKGLLLPKTPISRLVATANQGSTEKGASGVGDSAAAPGSLDPYPAGTTGSSGN